MKTPRELAHEMSYFCGGPHWNGVHHGDCDAKTAAITERDAEWSLHETETLVKVLGNNRDLRAERDRLRYALEEAKAFIGKARGLLGDWQSDGWSKPVSRGTSEFFASTDIAYGCEYVGCELPWGHKHVSGGPAQDQKQDIAQPKASTKSEAP